MTEINLSSDARRRLWQCYALLLELADEAEQNTTAESELCEDLESATPTEPNELTQSENDTIERETEQIGE